MAGLCLFLWKYIYINDILKHCEFRNMPFALPQTKISLVTVFFIGLKIDPFPKCNNKSFFDKRFCETTS